MNLKQIFTCLAWNYLTRSREPKPSLKDILRTGYKKPSSRKVHIVDADGLKKLADLHPYNQELYKTQDRQPNFIPFLSLANAFDGSIFFVIMDCQNRFIASLTLHPDIRRPQCLQLSQISVHRNYQNMGLATLLLHTGKTYLNTQRKDITEIIATPFEPENADWLKKVCKRQSSGLNARLLAIESVSGETIPLFPDP